MAIYDIAGGLKDYQPVQAFQQARSQRIRDDVNRNTATRQQQQIAQHEQEAPLRDAQQKAGIAGAERTEAGAKLLQMGDKIDMMSKVTNNMNTAEEYELGKKDLYELAPQVDWDNKTWEQAEPLFEAMNEKRGEIADTLDKIQKATNRSNDLSLSPEQRELHKNVANAYEEMRVSALAVEAMENKIAEAELATEKATARAQNSLANKRDRYVQPDSINTDEVDTPSDDEAEIAMTRIENHPKFKKIKDSNEQKELRNRAAGKAKQIQQALAATGNKITFDDALDLALKDLEASYSETPGFTPPIIGGMTGPLGGGDGQFKTEDPLGVYGSDGKYVPR